MLRHLGVVLIVFVSLSVDDLYGRDAGFIVEAMKRSSSAWKRVETKFVSGLECKPERLFTELDRLVKDAKPADLVFIHASTHGTTEDGLLRLDSEHAKVIDANDLSARLAKLPCPSLVTIDACQAGGAVRSSLPKQSAWLLGCSETQSTSGQTDDLKVPHGFLVLALCEALRGDAESDNDGAVNQRQSSNGVSSNRMSNHRISHQRLERNDDDGFKDASGNKSCLGW